MKKSYLTNGNGIVITIITDNTRAFVETAISSGQFGFIRATAAVTEIEAETMIEEMTQKGFNYREEK